MICELQRIIIIIIITVCAWMISPTAEVYQKCEQCSVLLIVEGGGRSDGGSHTLSIMSSLPTPHHHLHLPHAILFWFHTLFDQMQLMRCRCIGGTIFHGFHANLDNFYDGYSCYIMQFIDVSTFLPLTCPFSLSIQVQD